MRRPTAFAICSRMWVLDLCATDISSLNPEDLREVLRRLCEAELISVGLPASAVTAGGDDRAADGGVDVRVDWDGRPEQADFIPRPLTLFQVKQVERGFGPAQIEREMAPEGALRPAIAECAQRGGAYVIVSGKESLADSALQQRRAAMARVVSEHGAAGLHVEFYDADRLARWANRHPAVACWVRERIGKPLLGWRPYGSWAWPEGTGDEPYLVDDTARVTFCESGSRKTVTVTEALGALRKRLAEPRAIVRLVGLSGTGKTRLAQALCDERVGEGPLPRTLAVYGDAAGSLDPDPQGLVTRLGMAGVRCVLVIDNVPADLHRRLSETLRGSHAARLSLLTIEHDIADDEPEGTEVFRLDVASDAVIGRLLELRAPDLSWSDHDTIVRLSGGNARIALALAEAARRSGSLVGLRDAEVFQRLFWQRNAPDHALLRAAGTASLVRSFSVEDTSEGKAELPLLAGLARMDAADFREHVTELQQRGLAQARGVWRAVLPQALALRLAARRIEDIGAPDLAAFFETRASLRLLRSFTRQVGHLHESEAACRIASAWLGEGGFLERLYRGKAATGDGSFPERQDVVRLVANLAPLAPDLALAWLERAFRHDRLGVGGWDGAADVAARLLRQLAYEAGRFERAVLLWIGLIEAADGEREAENATGDFAKLFQPILSFTHASFDIRADVVRRLIASGSPRALRLAEDALKAMLEAQRVSGPILAPFGAHRRDDGWRPKTYGELWNWYCSALALVVEACRGGATEAARRAFLSRLAGLATIVPIHEAIEETYRALAGGAFWAEGWQEVRRLRNFRLDGAKARTEEASFLRRLDEMFRPRGLRERAEALLRCGPQVWLAEVADPDVDDGSDASWERRNRRILDLAAALGAEVAREPDVLRSLMPEIVAARTTAGLQKAFGRGLAQGAANPCALWATLRDTFLCRPPDERSAEVLAGFVEGVTERDPDDSRRMIREIVGDPRAGASAVAFASLLPTEERWTTLARLAARTDVPAQAFGGLAFWQPRPPAETIAAILCAIADREDGLAVVCEIVSMLWQPDQSAVEHLCGGHPRLLDLVEDALVRCCAGQLEPMEPFHVEQVSAVAARLFETDRLRRLTGHLLDSERERFGVTPEILATLLGQHPAAVLDEALARGEPAADRLRRVSLRDGRSLFAGVDPEAVLTWAKTDPQRRFAWLARAVPMLSSSRGNNSPTICGVFHRLLEGSPDQGAFLEAAAESFSFQPCGWGGLESFSAARRLIEGLPVGNDPRGRRARDRILQSLDRDVAELSRQLLANQRRFE